MRTAVFSESENELCSFDRSHISIGHLVVAFNQDLNGVVVWPTENHRLISGPHTHHQGAVVFKDAECSASVLVDPA
jgi:hypothetical protein